MTIPPSLPIQVSESPEHRHNHHTQIQTAHQGQPKTGTQDTLQTNYLPPQKTLAQLALWESKDEKIQSIAEIEQLLNDVIQQSFPELKNTKIGLASFKAESVFFQSNFKPLSLLKKNKHYLIQVNSAILQRQLPKQAAKAILAHELSHTLDYHKGGVGGILKVGWQIVTDEDCYEHRTDIQAIARGYGQGLMAYRNWIYTQIPAQDLPHKQATYYQPQEIEVLMQHLSEAEKQGFKPQLIEIWLKQPPMNVEEMKRSFQQVLGKNAVR